LPERCRPAWAARYGDVLLVLNQERDGRTHLAEARIEFGQLLAGIGAKREQLVVH
jgi:hypothetical protein